MKNLIIIKWTSRLETGITIIDKQHQELVGFINELYTYFYHKIFDHRILDVITRMYNYAALHFSTEEKMFAHTNYIYTAEHKKEHNSFVLKAKSLKEDFENKTGNLTFALINFLKDWLNSHILVSDMKYVDCLKKHGF